MTEGTAVASIIDLTIKPRMQYSLACFYDCSSLAPKGEVNQTGALTDLMRLA
jgi:hypothetical protein